MADAIAAQQKAIALKPEYVTARVNLAVAYADMGRNEEAIQALREALRINPNFPEAHIAHYNLGVNYERLAQFDLALREYEAALLLRPDFAAARLQLDRLRTRTPAGAPTAGPAPLLPR